MSYNMEQKFLDFLQHLVEVRRKLISMFGGESRFIIDNLLNVGHHVVDILRRRDFALLTLVVEPHVQSEKCLNQLQ